MKPRPPFAINFIIAVFVGLAGFLFPRWVLRSCGATWGAAAICSTRLAGESILEFAALSRSRGTMNTPQLPRGHSSFSG
jgi:hypothetical protein